MRAIGLTGLVLLLTGSVPLIGACSKRKSAQRVDVPVAIHSRGVDEVCLPSRWCWENPRPTGDWLHAVNGSGAARAWAAGEGGTILRWDGERWSFDGSAPATILSLAASSNGEVWAAGKNGTLLRRTKDAWSVVSIGTTAALRSVAADDSGAAWVVGGDGLAFRCRDDSCRRISTGTDAFFAIAGLSEDSLFFAGDLELIRRWTGSWARTEPTNCRLRRVSAEGLRPATYRAAWAATASDVWLVGDDCSPRRWDGHRWTAYGQPLRPHASSAVWGSTSNDVWAVGDAILHWDGTRWSEWGQPLRPQILAITGATEAAWALARGWSDEKLPKGHDLVLRSENGRWQTSIASDTPLFGIHSNGVDTWVCGTEGIILHWDGVGWESLSVETKVRLAAIWGTRNDLWVAGEQGLLMRRHNGTWSRVELDVRQTLSAFWGDNADDIWLVGDAGALFHWDGRSWRPFTLDVARDLSAITGTAANDVWIAGDRALLHWDGAHWSSTEDIKLKLQGLCTDEAGDVWTVDEIGSLIRHHGATSERIRPAPTTNDLQSVYCHGRNVWVGGAEGTILRYQPDL